MSHKDDPKVTTTSGEPPSIAEGPAPEPVDPKTGQHGAYWVLTEEERAKGFVRPVRIVYQHVGPPGPRGPVRDLTKEEQGRYNNREPRYAKFEPYGDSGKEGRFWTQEQLDGVLAGCGTTTTMSRSIAETYARDPKFYGLTFCVHCKDHFPVEQFVWGGTDELVGS